MSSFISYYTSILRKLQNNIPTHRPAIVNPCTLSSSTDDCTFSYVYVSVCGIGASGIFDCTGSGCTGASCASGCTGVSCTSGCTGATVVLSAQVFD